MRRGRSNDLGDDADVEVFLTKEVEEKVREALEERSNKKRWNQVTRMAEESVKTAEAKRVEELAEKGGQQKRRAKPPETPSIVYSGARTAANSLVWVMGTLSLLVNTN
jgi:hypothetical protein